MKDKYLYIVDIRFKQKRLDCLEYIINKNVKFLSLTPYSSYLLDKRGYEYLTYHDIISIDDFRDSVIDKCNEIEKLIKEYKEFSYLTYYLLLIYNKQVYYQYIINYIKINTNENYEIIYISDTKAMNNHLNYHDFMLNNYSLLHSCNEITKFIHVENKNILFYYMNKLKVVFHKIFFTERIIYKLLNILFRKKNALVMYYDNIYYKSFFDKLPLKEGFFEYRKSQYTEVKTQLLKILKIDNTFIPVDKMQDAFFSSLESALNNSLDKNNLQIKPFIFLSNNNEFIRVLMNKQNKTPNIFMQHGSYLHESVTLKYCEIYPSDINFVFNEYTKKLFMNRGAKKVEVVGSIKFNKKYKDIKIKYDYVYITYCSSYAYPGTFINMSHSNISMDGMNMFNRHKGIIEMFGRCFPTKKICIKVQSNIMLSHLYIPLLELSATYKNITIDFTTSLHSLIEKSQYIISDYFSSEFINRELHYKKDIILFKDAPYKIEDTILNDMDKMFILISSLHDLQTTIKTMNEILKKRNKYDAIIEYYSSKKCDTENIVKAFLLKEFYGR